MNTQNSKKVGVKSLASATFNLKWTESDVVHEDRLHFEKFSAWRDIDTLPAAMANLLIGSVAGDVLEATAPAGDWVPGWSEGQSFRLPVHAFDGQVVAGHSLAPACGRFYPRGFFHGYAHIVREETVPARITALDENALVLDLNHPLARFPLAVSLTIEAVHDEIDLRGGRCNNCIDELLHHPGLAARLADGRDTTFIGAAALERMDDTPDSAFYSLPRPVQHLDARALETVEALYAQLIPGGATVLDLMASFDSHLTTARPESLSVLGMNAVELAANAEAEQRTVQDLNGNARLPYPAAHFDAVVCTASVEYLTNPLAVFAEVRRVLKPGGIFISTFSNRWFPTKAIQIWSELHEFERLGLVTQWYRQAGFGDLHTYSARGWPRPPDDAHAATQRLSDPVFAVWGRV